MPLRQMPTFLRKRLLWLIAAGLFSASPLAAGDRGAIMPPPGDADKAVLSEYRRLKAKGTRAALELFIARHPGHPLTERARRDLDRL